MENSDKDILLLQSLRRKHSTELSTDISPEPEHSTELSTDISPEPEHSTELSTDISPEPEQEQQDESEPDTQLESNQETPEPSIGPPPLALIEFRIQQLNNRRILLQKMQAFRRKAGDSSSRTTEGMSPVTCEDSDDLCELTTVQKELEELLVKKEELENQENCSNITGNGQVKELTTFFKNETPWGGVYMLPPPQPNQEITLEEIVKTSPAAEVPLGPIVPAESLGRTSVLTQCPSCGEIIATETRSSMSEVMWLLCCLCSIMGCVAGCCLIPLFTDRLKKVRHQCPLCGAHISTFQPF